jgi:chlorobactene glucosyltransferase
MMVLFWITAGIGTLWAILFTTNLAKFLRAPEIKPGGGEAGELPKVSVVIPARDEEKNIERCLRSLLAQEHKDIEILVVNDNSSDRTAEIVERMAADDARIRLFSAAEPPGECTGKCNALIEGVRQGNPAGEWLLFTDADTRHHPKSLSSALRTAREKQVDLLTLIPHLEARTFWERLMQPTVAALIALFKQPEQINDPDDPEVFANGQFILVRKEAYQSCGGHQAISGKVLDDTELARTVVQSGCRMHIALARELFSTRMYTSFSALMAGWTKNFYMILESRFSRVLLAAGLALFMSLWPAGFGIASIVGLATGAHFWPEAYLLIAVGIYAMVLTFQATLRGLNRWYPHYSPLAPLANFMAVFILLRSAYLNSKGRGVRWKGRIVFDDKGDAK